VGTTVINPGTVRGEFCAAPDQILGEYAIADLYRPTTRGYTWNPILMHVRWDMDAMYAGCLDVKMARSPRDGWRTLHHCTVDVGNTKMRCYTL
jgi:hypothetical protein